MTITYNYNIITVPDVFSVSKHPGLHGFHWSFSEAYPLVEVQVPIPIVLTWTTDHHWPVSATFSRVLGGVICGRMAIQKRIEKWCTTIINNLSANGWLWQSLKVLAPRAGSNPVLYYSSRLIQLLLQPCSDMNTLMIEMQDALMYAHHSNIPAIFFRGSGSAPGAFCQDPRNCFLFATAPSALSSILSNLSFNSSGVKCRGCVGKVQMGYDKFIQMH